MSTHNPTPTEHLAALRERILDRFDLEELRALVFDLGVNYDDLRGETISAKIRALLEHLEKRRRTPDLLATLKQHRPNEDWDSYFPAEPEARSPYKGLQFFTEADAHLFFGRERLTAQLIERLRKERFLVVVGASGSGKSSLVRAGLVPAVRRGKIEVNDRSSRDWPIHIITPTDQPIKTLAVSLTRDVESVTAATTLAADLRKDSDSLDLFLMRQTAKQPNTRLLLVVDQFEELFTLCEDKRARQKFVNNLVTAVQSGTEGRLKLVLTLRADFYAFAVQYESLRSLLETGQQIVGEMSETELREAILKPAVAEDWRFQPGLVETILQDVEGEPGSLPLLSHALQETWNRRERRQLTLAGYQNAGGVRGAIAKTADAVYADLPPDQQSLARTIFLRLTELGEGTEDTRRRVWQTELVRRADEQETVATLLQRLANARLITTDTLREQDGEVREVVEVSHEALIREWPELRAWLDENRERLRLHRRLGQDTKEWLAAGRDVNLLYRGGKLAQARELTAEHDDELNENERTFILAGVEEEERVTAEREAQRQRELAAAQELAEARQGELEAQQRRTTAVRRAVAGLCLLLVIAIVATVFAFSASRQATEEAENAVTSEANAQAAATDAIAAQETAQAEATRADVNLATAVSAQETAIADRNDAETQRLNAQNAEATAVAAAEQNQTLAQENAAIAATAQAQRDEAESQSRIFLAQYLVALGPVLVQQGGSTDFSKLFAIEAIRINRQESGSVNLLADSILRQSLQWPIPNQGLEGHEGAINTVSWSVDGRWLASGGWDSTVRVWDMQNQDAEPVILRGPHEPVHFVAWSPDGRWLATVSGYIAASDIIGREGTIRIWDTQEWDIPPVVLGGHDDGIYSVSWSPDGQWLASAGNDSTVRIWNTQDWEEQALVLMGHRGSVDSVSWSPDGQWLASSGADGIVRIWYTENWETEPITLRGHESRIWSLSWSPDSHFLASGGFDRTIRLWDARDWDATSTVLRDHEDIIRSVVWSPDGRWLASGSADSTIRVWDAGSWTTDPIILYGHSDAIWSVSWSVDGHWLASGSADQIVRVWDAEKWPVEPVVLTSYLHYGNTISWSSNGRWVAAGGYDGTVVVETQNSGTGAIVFTDPERDIDSVAWSADGRRLASAGGRGARTSVWVRDAQNWDAEPITLTGQSIGALSSVAWSHNDRWLAAGGGGEAGAVAIWDVQDWNQDPIVLTGHEDTVSSVSWSSDDHWLASASHDSTVRIWDTDQWDAEPLILSDHEGWVRAVSWSSDSRWLASAGDDRFVRVWDTQNWGADPIILAGHEDWVSSLSWSADGRWLASGSADQTIRIWDTQIWDADPIVLAGHVDWVRGVSWSHDSHWLASSSTPLVSSDVRVWASLDQLIEMSCRTVIRNFTWDEWQTYLPDEPYNRTCPNLPVHPTFIESGRALARSGEIEEAIIRFEEALALDPTLELDPEQEAMRNAVTGLVEQGRELARSGETEEAIARFEEALALDPTLALDPEQEIKWVIVTDLVGESATLFSQANTEAGASVLEEAHALVPDFQMLPIEIASELSAYNWNRLCWWGSLWGYAAEVIDACEVAVELTEEEDVGIRDSRGVALAIINENSDSIERAIADFEAFVAERGHSDVAAQLRLEWIDALKAGENPFDNATLEMLRNERFLK